MNKNILLQLILIYLFLFQFSSISANRYGAYCSSDSDCDQHQKCLSFTCRCNVIERRFWTGEICAICVTGFTITFDRCYKAVQELKTWSEARSYCRDRYADLFTWRNNNDEQFIRPVVQSWSSSNIFQLVQSMVANKVAVHQYIAWAGAIITSLNPHTTKWMDPDGMKLTLSSSEWCDPTVHAGYTLPKEPTSGTRKNLNLTEREECVTYNFGTSSINLLCLADDYCSQKYPFICEMNAASMKLANTVLHGPDDEDINFEEEVPTPIPSVTDSGIVNPSSESITNLLDKNSPSALSANSSTSPTTLFILIIVGIILIIGAIIGYIIIKKKKQSTNDTISKDDGESEGRPSFTSSVRSMVE